MSKQHDQSLRPAEPANKLRQTQAEYSAARPASAPDRKLLSGVKMYVCRRCQSNFKTGGGRPDAKVSGLGKCNACLMDSSGLLRASDAAT